MAKPIAEYINDIDAAFSCDAGIAIDALAQLIETQKEHADPILECIHFKLDEARTKHELLCSEAKQYCCAPEDPAS